MSEKLSTPNSTARGVVRNCSSIFPAGILVTEGCRGDGGLLKDVDGHRFMPDYEPEKKELASRDVVSRRMETHIRKGKGVKSRFGEHLWLDITLLGRAHIEKNLREVKDICESFLGIDPAEKWIAVRPAQHYTMGGVRTQPSGESPTLKGLFAAGEAACWDMHGFNRLGGNSLSDLLVFGKSAGDSAVEDLKAGKAHRELPADAADTPTIPLFWRLFVPNACVLVVASSAARTTSTSSVAASVSRAPSAPRRCASASSTGRNWASTRCPPSSSTTPT